MAGDQDAQQPEQLFVAELLLFQHLDIYSEDRQDRVARRAKVRQILKEQRAAHQERLKRYNEDIPNIVEAREREVMGFRRAEAEILAKLNGFALIANLPRELLEKVFMAYVQDAHWTFISNREMYPTTSEQVHPYGWIKITQVCRYWRTVARERSALWSWIFPMTRRLIAHEFVTMVLELSASSPLTINGDSLPSHDVFIYPHRDNMAETYDTLKYALDHLARVRNLRITLDPRSLELFRSSTARFPEAPILEVLHIDIFGNLVDLESAADLVTWSLPNLTWLGVRWGRPTILNALLRSSLTSLTLLYFNPRLSTVDLARALRGLPLLEYLTLDNCEQPTSIAAQSVQRQLTDIGRVRLAALKRLRYIDDHRDLIIGQNGALTIVNLLDAPSDAHVTILLRGFNSQERIRHAHDVVLSSISRYIDSETTTFRARSIVIREFLLHPGNYISNVSLWDVTRTFSRAFRHLLLAGSWEEQECPNLSLYDPSALRDDVFLTRVFSKLDLTNLTTLYVSRGLSDEIWDTIFVAATRLQTLFLEAVLLNRGFMQGFGRSTLSTNTDGVRRYDYPIPQLRVLEVSNPQTSEVLAILEALRLRKEASLELRQLSLVISPYVATARRALMIELVSSMRGIVEVVMSVEE